MRKITLLALVLAAVFMVSGVALAQDAGPVVVCTGLVDEDCAILTGAAEAEPVSSASFIAQMLLTATDPEEEDAVPRDALALTAVGTYSVDTEAIAELDPTVVGVERVRDVLAATDVDATVTVYVPADPAGEEEAAFSQVTTFNLRIIDGTAFVNFPDFGDEVGADDWFSVEIGELVGRLGSPRAGILATAFSPGLGRGVRPADIFGATIGEEFAQVQRLEMDPDALVAMIGEDAAVFQTIYDVGGFFTDPATEGLLMDAITTEAELAGVDLLDPDRVELFDLRRSLFGDSVVRFIDYVGLEVPRLLRRDVVIDDLALGAVSEDAADVAGRIFSLVFAVQYADFDTAAVAVDAPENVVEVEAADVINAFGLAATDLNTLGAVSPGAMGVR